MKTATRRVLATVTHLKPQCPKWCTDHGPDGHRSLELMIFTSKAGHAGKDNLNYHIHGTAGDEDAAVMSNKRIRELLTGDDLTPEEHRRVVEAFVTLAELMTQ